MKLIPTIYFFALKKENIFHFVFYIEKHKKQIKVDHFDHPNNYSAIDNNN